MPSDHRGIRAPGTGLFQAVVHCPVGAIPLTHLHHLCLPSEGATTSQIAPPTGDQVFTQEPVRAILHFISNMGLIITAS